jgi:hypothetical protein
MRGLRQMWLIVILYFDYVCAKRILKPVEKKSWGYIYIPWKTENIFINGDDPHFINQFYKIELWLI